MSKSDFVEAIRLVESYVFRRTICNLSTNSLNKTFPALANSIDESNYLESMQAYLQSRTAQARFPNDKEFKEEIKKRDLYQGLKRKEYYFVRLENHNKNELISIGNYTIEHIMPQNLNKWSDWKKSIGDKWESIHEKYLHTLGNLTLTGYNTEYSNKTFAEKRDMAGGFKNSPLTLNSGLGQVEEWNESEINKRAERLAKKSLKVWQYPNLDDDTIERYRKKLLQDILLRMTISSFCSLLSVSFLSPSGKN